MRIGMFCDMYKPYTSGVTHYVSLNKRFLESLGHEVFVLTFGNRDYVDDEPGVLRSPAIAWGDTGWQLGLRPTALARKVAATLDVAHVQHPFLSGRVALALCHPHDIPVVFTSHTRYDLYSDTYAWWVPRDVRMAYLRTYLARFARRSDLVIAPSASIGQWLSDFGITDDALVLPNGVDTAPFARPAKVASRAELGVAEDAVVFCYVGRVAQEKNVGALIGAFARAAAENPNAALVIVGDGPERENAEELACDRGLADRVRFLGSVPYERVPAVLAASDAFVTASVSEVHPLVIVEAMAAGLPIVAIDSPGISDTVVDGVSGLLAAEDPRDLAERISRVASDAVLRQHLAEGASSAAAAYDVERTGRALLGAYERVLAHSSGNRPA